MKNIKYAILLVCVLSTLEWACKDQPDVGCDANFLEAEINGLPWTASKVTGFKGGIGGQISILAESEIGSKPTLSFGLPCDIGTGNYDLTLEPGVWDYGAYIYPQGGGVYYSEAGNMDVTVHDTSARILKGTFEFAAASGDIYVGKGIFCVKY